MKSISLWKKRNRSNRHSICYLVYWLLGISFNTLACQNTDSIPGFDPKGKMLFVEDCDGAGGLLSFRFGDLVVFDPQTKEKFRLTNDQYYDAHPSWSSDGQKIIFESKRIDNGDRIFDLSDKSHLFIFDIRTGRIKQFDKDFPKEFEGQLGEENRRPAWSPISNKIAFLTSLDFRTYLVILDTDKNRVMPLVQPGQFSSIDRLRWSPNEDYIAFDFYIKGKLINRGIAMVHLQSKVASVISDSSQDCAVGGWSSDGSKFLFDGYVPGGNGPHLFYVFSPVTKIVSMINNIPFNITGSYGQYRLKNELFAFIGSNRDVNGLDIWTYNLSDGKVERLTTDGHDKEGLTWYAK